MERKKFFKKRNITYFMLLKYPWIAWFESRVPTTAMFSESLKLIYSSRFPGVIPLQGYRADKAELMTFQSERSSDRLTHTVHPHGWKGPSESTDRIKWHPVRCFFKSLLSQVNFKALVGFTEWFMNWWHPSSK